MWRVVIFSCCVAVAASQTTTVSQCTGQSGTPLPLHTYIEGCTTPPCLLPTQSTVVMHVVFRSPRTITSLTTLVNAFLFGLPIGVPHDLQEDANTCKHLTNTYCPVLENEVVQYTLRMEMDPLWPVGVAPTLEFFVADSPTTPRNNLWCIRVPVRITEAVSASSSALNGTVVN